MTTTNPSPFANPASQQQPAIADQYPVAGAEIMQNTFTGPRAALSAYRNGTARGGSLAKPMVGGPTPQDTPMRNPPGGYSPNASTTTGAIASAPQTMQTGPQQGLQGYLANLASGGGGTNAGGMGPGRARSPGVMNPTRARY